jgi:hypothetical protein
MTPNQSHVAGLELALSKVDPWSAQAVWLRDLAAQAQSAPAEVAQGEPAAWIRFRSDGGIEGPHCDIDDVRKRSGVWTPLYTVPQPDAELVALRKDAERYRFARHNDNDCFMLNTLQRVSGDELDAAIDAKLASLR